ncbi:MAG: hypothetical protein IIB15_05825, partial [Chloroflexi bacterium]|nr:hypothetical protein [Chloroflexota bacterium]
MSQAAYEEALKYAKEREQFGISIYNIPVVANMLIEMRVTLEANRALLYSAAQKVDLKERLDERIKKLKENKSVKEIANMMPVPDIIRIFLQHN